MMKKKQRVRDARELCVKRRLEINGKSVESGESEPATDHP